MGVNRSRWSAATGWPGGRVLPRLNVLNNMNTMKKYTDLLLRIVARRLNRAAPHDGRSFKQAATPDGPGFASYRRLSHRCNATRHRDRTPTFRPRFLANVVVLGGLLAGIPTLGAAADDEWKRVGDQIPDAELRTADNEPFSLREEVSEQPTLLVFYRGGWCPFCTAHLRELAGVEEEIREMGIRIIGISPDRPGKVKESRESGDFAYLLLSDSDMDAARGFGIAFQVEPELVRTYKEDHGIDLEADSGRDHHLLPHPAVFVIDTEGVIRYADVNPDYRERLPGEELIEAAKSVAETAR